MLYESILLFAVAFIATWLFQFAAGLAVGFLATTLGATSTGGSA